MKKIPALKDSFFLLRKKAILSFCFFAFFSLFPSVSFAQYTGGGYDGYSSSSSESEVAGVNEGAPDHINFSTSIVDIYPGQVISAGSVSLVDANNNTVPTTGGDVVTISIYNNPGAATLGGTTTDNR